MEFHVHTNTSNLAVRAMLAQNPTGKCDQPIAYACIFLNNVEKNYTTTKRKALTMVYALHKFRHYVLGNKFVFYINHMALLYPVKRFQLSGQIARWLLLFLEYDLLVYKPRRFHLVVDVLLWLHDATENLGVLDKTTNTSLFLLQLEWL